MNIAIWEQSISFNITLRLHFPFSQLWQKIKTYNLTINTSTRRKPTQRRWKSLVVEHNINLTHKDQNISTIYKFKNVAFSKKVMISLLTHIVHFFKYFVLLRFIPFSNSILCCFRYVQDVPNDGIHFNHSGYRIKFLVKW